MNEERIWYAKETEGDNFETNAACLCELLQVAQRYTARQAWFCAANLAAHALAYEAGGPEAVTREVDQITNDCLVMLRFHLRRLFEAQQGNE